MRSPLSGAHCFQGRQCLYQFFHSRCGPLEGRVLLGSQLHFNDLLDTTSSQEDWHPHIDIPQAVPQARRRRQQALLIFHTASIICTIDAPGA